MKHFNALTHVCLALVLALLLGACDPGGLDPVTRKAADRIDATVAALNQNSADWQQLVRDLVSDLKGIRQDVANDVQAIATRGIATAGVEFRCDADFIGKRVKEGLQALSAKLRGQTPPPLEPVVCQIAFSPPQIDQAHINMMNVPDEVLFYGYNFDITSENGLTLVLKHSAGEMPLQTWVNKPTHYLLTLKTAPGDGVPMCNLKDRSVVLRWGNKEVYSVGVIAYVCPLPPPAPTPLPERYVPGMPVTDKASGKFIGGTGLDREYGGNCSNGYRRSSYQILRLTGQGQASVEDRGWVDDDENNCRIRVHYSISSSSPNLNPNFVEAQIIIKEQGKQLPAPQPRPCLCQ